MCHQAYRNDRLTEKKFMLCTGVALLVVLSKGDRSVVYLVPEQRLEMKTISRHLHSV